MRRRLVLTLDGRLATVREVARALWLGQPCMVGAFMLVGPVEEQPPRTDDDPPVDLRDLN